MTSKNIIAKLNINMTNLMIGRCWRNKIVLRALKKKYSIAPAILASFVVDDLIHECGQFPVAHNI